MLTHETHRRITVNQSCNQAESLSPNQKWAESEKLTPNPHPKTKTMDRDSGSVPTLIQTRK